MMKKSDFWEMFRQSGKIEFYNAYRALSDMLNGQEGKSNRNESGSV